MVLRTTLGLLLSLTLAVPLQAEVRSAADFVQKLLAETERLGAAPRGPETRHDLRLDIARYVDVEAMARAALGTAWERLDDRLRTRYLRSYAGLLERVATKYRPSESALFERLVSRRRGDVELVAFRVKRTGEREHDLYWYVRTVPDYAIVDVAVDGVLVTQTQRREFEAIIAAQDGDLTTLPAAIDRLRP